MPTFINQILWEIGKRFRVVSSSFFGTIGSKYAQGISENLQLIQVRQNLFCVWIKVEHLAIQTDLIVDSFFFLNQDIYPGWLFRLHVNSESLGEGVAGMLCSLHCASTM